MSHELGQTLVTAPEESNWQERVELARAEAVNSEPKAPKRQKAPHYIKVIEKIGWRSLDGSQPISKKWVLCPDCKNGYHGH